MVLVTLHKDLQISKKLARWVTKLLDEEMNKSKSGPVRHS
jgi:hypothetical protein